jgi:two-component system alkaline phosphatase synthesis response regulator PhoP
MSSRAKTLLVVDDDPAIRECLEELFRYQGYHVLTAVNGEAGLQAVRKERPDLLVLDVAMPDLDGFRVATQIKNDPALTQMPIILYSGQLEESFALLAYETKAEYFLPKVGGVRPILAAVQDLLETSREAIPQA